MYERSGHIIRQKFREYLLPTVMTSMAISMASVVDGIIVGILLGEVALAAVGLSGPIIFCINLIYMPVSYTHLDVYKRQIESCAK